MPDLNNLFQAASTVGNDSKDDSWLIIDHDFRTIDIPANKKLLGVTSDERINILNFKGPRYYEGSDLSTFTIRIVYLNARGESDLYVATDIETDNDEMRFSWEVGRHACLYSGNVQFIVSAVLLDGEGYVSKKYNTRIHSLPVVEGIEPDQGIALANYDLITQFAKNIQRSVQIDQFVSDAEAYALGTRGGVSVDENDLTYHNNSKYYSESIVADKAEADELRLRAEAWAAGTRNGNPIGSSDAAYQNNAKYYMEETKNSLSTKIGLFYSSAEGSPAEIHDGADDALAKSLIIDILPTPDLHGYETPWPGGSKKNKLKLNGLETIDSGLTIRLPDNGEIVVDGMSTGIYYYVANTSLNTTALSGMMFSVNEVEGITWRICAANSTNAVQELSSGTILADNGTGMRLICRIANGLILRKLALKPMLIATTDNQTFLPYENRCDISGFQSIIVSRSQIIPATSESTDSLEISLGSAAPLYGGTSDIISGVSVSTHVKASVTKANFGDVNISGTGMNYREVSLGQSPLPKSGTNSTLARETQTCNLAVIANPDTDENYGEYVAIIYVNMVNNTPVFRISDALYQILSDNESIEIVYEMANSTAFQLPNSTFRTMLKDNYIWSNAGAISIEYPVDIKSYIDYKIEQLRERING